MMIRSIHMLCLARQTYKMKDVLRVNPEQEEHSELKRFGKECSRSKRENVLLLYSISDT